MRAGLLFAGLALGEAPPPDPAPVDAHALQRRLEDVESRLAQVELEVEDCARGATTSPSPARLQLGGEPVRVPAGARVGEARAFGAPILVDGEVLGNAVSFGGDVTVRSGAHVHGDAVSFGGAIHVLPGGRVDGDRLSFAGPTPPPLPQPEPWFDLPSPRVVVRRLVATLAFASVGVMVVGFFPGRVEAVAAALRARPIWSTVLGFLLAASSAFVGVLLTLTIIGLPLALLLVGLMAVAGTLGLVASCQALGDQLPIADMRARRWLAFLLGVAAFSFLGALPLVGQLALGMVGVAGLGASLQTRLGGSAAR